MWMLFFLLFWLNLQLPLLLCYSVLNLPGSQFEQLHLSKSGTRPLRHCKPQTLCQKDFLLCISARDSILWNMDPLGEGPGVCVISPWLRSQPPHTFPGFWGGPQMHFKSPRGHLTGGPAPPTPPWINFPPPTLSARPTKWRQMGTFTPSVPMATPYLTVLHYRAALPVPWTSRTRWLASLVSHCTRITARGTRWCVPSACKTSHVRQQDL